MCCLIIIVTALAVCVNTAPHNQVNVPTLDGRIVGGVPVKIEDYPYQISLQYFRGHICGGSIISKKHVVTAAHCTDGVSASSLVVRVGSSYRGTGGKIVTVRKIHQNPKYNSSNTDYDITVLKLLSSLSFNEGVSPIRLSNEGEEVAAGTLAYCTGWGTLSESGSLPYELQVVEVPIVSRELCKSAYASSYISDRMICAGVPAGGVDACQGDSGGPLVANGQLVGVVSWGYGCARPDYPGVYSNVAELRSYIKSVTGI